MLKYVERLKHTLFNLAGSQRPDPVDDKALKLSLKELDLPPEKKSKVVFP